MAFAKFMASTAGRGVRILLGIALIIAGVFNVCLIAPLLGVPFSGNQLLKS